MSSVRPAKSRLQVVGRSSSHFTRVVRLFAEECGVAYDLRVVPNLLATDAEVYGGNPALRLPNLLTHDGPIFGSLPSCRALAGFAAKPFCMVWPEQLRTPVSLNALELTLQAMSTEVSYIMLRAGDAGGSSYAAKLAAALGDTVAWLDLHVERALADLPERDVSYLELSLFCLVEHLEFREVMSTAKYANLRRFCERFAERPSAQRTPFRYDV